MTLRGSAIARFAIPLGFAAVALASLLLTSQRKLQGDEFHYHSISIIIAEAILSAVQGLPVNGTQLLNDRHT